MILRNIIIILSIGLSLSANAFQQRVITKSKVGDLEIGMTANDIYDIYGFDNVVLFDQFLEATFSPALSIKDEGIVAELDCGDIFRIKVYSGLYKTEKGIHVGSSVAHLKNAYPETSILYGEGIIVVNVKAIKMSFVLDISELNPNKLERNEYKKIEDLPSQVKIAQVLVL